MPAHIDRLMAAPRGRRWVGPHPRTRLKITLSADRSRLSAIPPNTVENSRTFAGTSSGIYASNYRGLDWHQDNNGLPLLTLRTFALRAEQFQYDPGGHSLLRSAACQLSDAHCNPTVICKSRRMAASRGTMCRAGSIKVRRVAFSPDAAHDHTAFACAGTVGADGYQGGGVYRSTSDGWLWNTQIVNAACNDLALSPNYAIDHTAWAYIVGQGVLRTTNGGDAWDVVNNNFVAELIDGLAQLHKRSHIVCVNVGCALAQVERWRRDLDTRACHIPSPRWRSRPRTARVKLYMPE